MAKSQNKKACIFVKLLSLEKNILLSRPITIKFALDQGHNTLLVEKDAFNSKRKMDKRYSHLEYVISAHLRGRYKTEVISQANKRVPGY